MFGTLPRGAHVAAAGLAFEPALCESAAVGLPRAAAASAAPGRPRRAQVTPAGIGAASGRRETYDEDWLQTELRQWSSQPRDPLGSDEGVRLLRVIVQVTLAVYCVDRAHRVPRRRFPPAQVTPE